MHKKAKAKAKPKDVKQLLTGKIERFIARHDYSPMTEKELFDALNLSVQDREIARKSIYELLSKEKITVQKKRFFLKKKLQETVQGKLHAHPKGFGFVTPEHALESGQDIFIPKHLMNHAVDGDTVEVEINPDSFSPKGPEGRIVNVIKRAHSVVAVIVQKVDAHGKAIAYSPMLGKTQNVWIEKAPKKKIQVGDRFLVKILEWGKGSLPAEVELYLGNISDPSCDITSAMYEYDLPQEFDKEVKKEALKFGEEVSETECKKRKDLTGTISLTIDPTTAKDFDDALSIYKDKKGHVHLGVHIADVAHYVQTGSQLDHSAKKRCNSTYFPGFCLPMLPEELSNQLCSLKPDVVRLTVTVQMEFDKEGTLLKYEIFRSFIKSAKRFTYEEAFAVIEKKEKSEFAPQLDLMVELCHLLKKKRYERGSIDFALPELVIVLDKNGTPIGTQIVEYDISHQMVEEFMLKANEVVAKHLSDQGKSLLFRIHEKPTEENYQEFFSLARALGFELGKDPTIQDIQKLFEEAKKTPFGQHLSVGFIRMMKMAYYSPENVGHYGLALEHYTHFTSPIRRYTDLIIQRLLFGELHELPELEEIGKQCSDQERVSMRAENSVKQLKKLRLLQTYFKEDPKRIYDGTVTKIKPFGLFFEMTDLMLEGFLHISELENDYFVYDERKKTLIGRSTNKIHKVGEFLTLTLQGVDLIEMQATWRLCVKKRKT